MSKRRSRIASRESREQRSPNLAQADALLASDVPLLILFAALLATALLVYRPAFGGPFFSDDVHYMLTNPYVNGFSWDRLGELLDPRGEPVRLVENYSPVHLLLHAAAWRAFGEDVVGHHVLNVVLHALASTLLVALLRASRLPMPAAALGGVFFLLHPANVEAVAWISQLKTTSSLVLALTALLLLERSLLLATLAFVLALLAKPTAAFVLPVAAVLVWTRGSGGTLVAAALRRAALCLGIWTLVLIGFSVAEFVAFLYATEPVEFPYADRFEQLRSSVALFMRYLAMASTSYGVSAFHEVPPVRSTLDPWWIGGLVFLTLIGARTLVALRARREEAAWWVWALVSFLPVSQAFPFRFPMGDRYLYPLLPGLIGGILLAAAPWAAALARRRPWAPAAAILVALAALAPLGARSYERARLWNQPVLLLADSASNYPDGMQAHVLRARRAAAIGDVAESVRELRLAYDRGFDRFEILLNQPVFAALRGDPGFERLLRDMADLWIGRFGGLERPSQAELYSLAAAHMIRGEAVQMRSYLERALAHGGPLDDSIQADLSRLPPAPARPARSYTGAPEADSTARDADSGAQGIGTPLP